MNPYELLNLDAGANVQVLTEALRGAMEAATDHAQREQLARVWEDVTQNAQARLEYALLAGPDLRVCKPNDHQVGATQARVTRKRKTKDGAVQARDELAADLIPLPSLLDLIEQYATGSRECASAQLHACPFGTEFVPIPAWENDPVLNKLTAGAR
jgi:hypothetical protein